MMQYDTLIEKLEIDLINVCNAKCPLCHFRNNYPESLRTRVALTRAALEDTLGEVRPQRVFIAGDLGEPTLSNELLPIIDLFVERDPSVVIVINTNGCTRSHRFWQTLAMRLPRFHEVLFAIDGLEDTYSIYRVGLDFTTTIGNARAFIEAGGVASWGFIEFEHNRHQVEEARSRAQALGFRAFRLRRSYAESAEIRRPPETPNDGARIAALWKSGEVPVEPDPFPYIQADGTLYPCCESNSGRYDPKIDFDFARLNLRRHGLSECLRVLPDYCATMQATYPLTCARRCGRFPEGQGPAGQDIGYGRAAGGG